MKTIFITVVLAMVLVYAIDAFSDSATDKTIKRRTEMAYIKGQIDYSEGRVVFKKDHFDYLITEDIIEGVSNEYEYYRDYVRSVK